MIGILGSKWTPRFLSWSFQVLFGPSRYWKKSSICDNLKHQKRCSEVLFFLECIRPVLCKIHGSNILPTGLANQYVILCAICIALSVAPVHLCAPVHPYYPLDVEQTRDPGPHGIILGILRTHAPPQHIIRLCVRQWNTIYLQESSTFNFTWAIVKCIFILRFSAKI